MIENLRKNTGKSLEEWISIVKKTGIEKHGEIIKYLKSEEVTPQAESKVLMQQERLKLVYGFCLFFRKQQHHLQVRKEYDLYPFPCFYLGVL